uniref:Anthranilate synthase component 2 n=1 Tax=Leachiella pacifica TaxID=282357 RepID=A0A3S8UVW9_9FLOR|nr:anthranilate synthase component II [Leachiella pacifica]
MVIIIDNYDSFTQNLVQCIGSFGCKMMVVRNDKISIKEIKKINPTHIILSPGPGSPIQSKISLKIMANLLNSISILGICLGHQAFGYQHGGEIDQMSIPVHGKISQIVHNQKDLFQNISSIFKAARYHSLIISNSNIPFNIEITAWSSDGIIMGCRHKIYKHLRGIQFHPESLWTRTGKSLLLNFLLS